ncbi:hypothetical protein [Oceanibaculum indicum]|uniref:Uncharacterized protein n=1 Tax=Oceanibaculum indicum P24 TaxID=1207063 RepID=K2IXA6_9PROT|nr:hypothetical protein [Oceanibaculum indicum]EKE75086.1 hypothetical protein P24_11315 [Oceanibaculum indicum P24]
MKSVAVFLALVVLALAAFDRPVQAQTPASPGIGATGKICFLLRNRSPVTLYGRVVLQSRERFTFRLERNRQVESCLVGTTYGGNRISLVLVNFLGLPLFSCYTTTSHAIDINARQQEEGWRYTADCR